MNAAQPELDKARDLPSPAPPEQREQHRDQLWRVHRRNIHNLVASHRDDQASSQIPRMVGQDRLRRRVTAEDLSVSGSARRHLRAQPNISNVEPARQREFGNRSPRLPVGEPRMRRASKEKECRALMVSRLRHNSASSRSSGRKVARPPQPIKAKPTGSRKLENKKQKNQPPCRGHNNFGAITPAAPDAKFRSRFC